MTVFEIVIVGAGEAALCAAATSARAGAKTALLRNKAARRTASASYCAIPNFVWRRLDLHEYDLSLAPVSARITLLPNGVSVTTHDSINATVSAFEGAQGGDDFAWPDFIQEMRALDEMFQLKKVSIQGNPAPSLLEYLDGDEGKLSALEQFMNSAVSALDDYLGDAPVKAHLAAHALGPSGMGGREAGSIAGLFEFLNEDAWRARSQKGSRALLQALEKLCAASGVTVFDSALKDVSSGAGRNHAIQLADGEEIKAKALIFATPEAAAAAGFRAPKSPMAGPGGARAQLHIQLKSLMAPPVGDTGAIFQIVDELADLQTAADAIVDGRLPDKLPVEFEFADNGDLIARTSYCPSAFREEDGWREWTGQDRQAVTRLIIDQLSSRMDGLASNIRKTNIKIIGSFSPDAQARSDDMDSIFIQPHTHNGVAAAVRLVDKVLGQ